MTKAVYRKVCLGLQFQRGESLPWQRIVAAWWQKQLRAHISNLKRKAAQTQKLAMSLNPQNPPPVTHLLQQGPTSYASLNRTFNWGPSI